MPHQVVAGQRWRHVKTKAECRVLRVVPSPPLDGQPYPDFAECLEPVGERYWVRVDHLQTYYTLIEQAAACAGSDPT